MDNTVMNDSMLKIRTEIEEKQNERKQIRRIIRWLVIGEVVFLLVFILGFLGAHFIIDTAVAQFLGWVTILDFFVVIGFAIAFISLLVAAEFDFGAYFSLKSKIETLQMKLRILEEQQRYQKPSLETYRSQLGGVIYQYQREANRYRRFHYTIQIMIILFSLLVTGLTSGLTGLLGGAIGKPWIAPILSLTVSFLTAMTALFRFRDRGFNLQQTADAIQYEINAADLGIFDYRGKSDKESLVELAERAERLKDEQRKRQQQLEQASDNKQPSEK